MIKSNKVIRKFTKSWNLEDLEIWTDSGWQDIVSLNETIPYLKYYIRTSAGKELECADDHIVFDENLNEIFVKDLQVGSKITTEDGNEEIIEIVNTGIEEQMYDFVLSDSSDHRYYTNGILSHNTAIAKAVATMLDVPFAVADSTTMSAAGYVGDDVESIITRLLMECDYDVKKAQKGIVFLDEIDKIARKGDSPSISRDVSGEGVQQGLLKLIEGSVIFCPPDPGRKHPEKPVIPVDTSDILFICAGAFEGIEKKIANRMNAHAVGFEATSRRQEKGTDDKDYLKYVTAADIRSFGLIPEIVGRLPIITHTNVLSEDDMVKILTEPKNALVKQYHKLMEIDGVNVTFSEDALKEIAREALKNKTGARGLRSVMERVMKDIMFNLPGSDLKPNEINIDLEYVKDHLKEE